jgi:GTPase Era involved in 16S rRNA processing
LLLYWSLLNCASSGPLAVACAPAAVVMRGFRGAWVALLYSTTLSTQIRSQVTTLSAQELTQEIIREKLWRNLNQEIPYHLSLVLNRWEVVGVGYAQQLHVECDVLVPRPSMQPIVIGKGGAVVRRVAEAVRLELAARYQRR